MRLLEPIRRRLLAWARRHHCDARPQDFLIENDRGAYLARWYVVRKGQRWLGLSSADRQRELEQEDPRVDGRSRNVFVHRFLASDDDRALHDHPWPWMTIILEGEYREYLPVDTAQPAGPATAHHRRAGDVVIRRDAARAHRIALIDERPVTTLFMTGRKTREWGFHCPKGWRHWRDFTAPDGRGKARGSE